MATTSTNMQQAPVMSNSAKPMGGVILPVSSFLRLGCCWNQAPLIDSQPLAVQILSRA